MAKQRSKKKAEKKPVNPEAQGLFFLALAFLSAVSLSSFSFLEPHANWLGFVGYIAALGIEYLFGIASYLIPAYFALLGARLLRKQNIRHLGYDHLFFDRFSENFGDFGFRFEEDFLWLCRWDLFLLF